MSTSSLQVKSELSGRAKQSAKRFRRMCTWSAASEAWNCLSDVSSDDTMRSPDETNHGQNGCSLPGQTRIIRDQNTPCYRSGSTYA